MQLCAAGFAYVYAIQHQAVRMHIETDRTVEALDTLYTRARLALAVARAERRSSLLSLAIGDARSLLREDMLWSQALGNLVLAGAASFGSRNEALRLLALAESQFASGDMLLHLELARARSGELLGGRDGQQLTAAALEQVGALGVKQAPARGALLFRVRALVAEHAASCQGRSPSPMSWARMARPRLRLRERAQPFYVTCKQHCPTLTDNESTPQNSGSPQG
jgi:hypothetical protein